MDAYLTYWARHADRFAEAASEHVALVGSVMGWSLVVAAVLAWVLLLFPRAERSAIQVLSAVYAIPSLALFSLLIPITGLGFGTAVPVMVVYNQFLLLRNIMEGIHGVDDAIVEAARGMGMSRLQVLVRVQLPLATPTIMAGVRLAMLSTIGIATIAATISAGGLGMVLLSGLRSMNEFKIVGGTLLCAGMALAADAVLRLVEVVLRRTVAHR